MRKHLVLAGGGHAHLFSLARLDRFIRAGIDVTCVAPGPYLSYSGMGPGMLSGRYAPEDLRFDIAAMVEDCGREDQKGLRPFRASPPGGQKGLRPFRASPPGGQKGLRPFWTSPPGGMIPPEPPRKGGMAALGRCIFMTGRIGGIDPRTRTLQLEDGRELVYDAVSFGIGSLVGPTVPVTNSPATVVYPVKPIENLLLARRVIESKVEAGETVRVLVAGGGSSGYEVAGNVLGLLASLGLREPRLTLTCPSGLLPGWPDRARRLARESLTRRGARIVTTRLTGLVNGRALLADGQSLACDLALVATGTRPPDLFARYGLSAEAAGGLTVNAFLQSPFFPEIFGGGDCIHFGPRPLPRAGVYAVRQGPVLGDNLLAFLTGQDLRPFRATGTRPLAILSSGDGRAILRKGSLVLEGRLCLALKDSIDRRFMRAFANRA